MQKFKDFITDHQKEIIQVAGAVVGALVGVAVVALVSSSSDVELVDTEEYIAEEA